jgi:uncharacterized membrane protein YhiD involved in acid resistance
VPWKREDMDISIWDWLLRLTLAGILGAVVGMERESRGHPAGVRTQALVVRPEVKSATVIED